MIISLETRQGVHGVYIIYEDLHGPVAVCATKQAGRDWLLNNGWAEDEEDLEENFSFCWEEIIYQTKQTAVCFYFWRRGSVGKPRWSAVFPLYHTASIFVKHFLPSRLHKDFPEMLCTFSRKNACNSTRGVLYYNHRGEIEKRSQGQGARKNLQKNKKSLDKPKCLWYNKGTKNKTKPNQERKYVL